MDKVQPPGPACAAAPCCGAALTSVCHVPLASISAVRSVACFRRSSANLGPLVRRNVFHVLRERHNTHQRACCAWGGCWPAVRLMLDHGGCTLDAKLPCRRQLMVTHATCGARSTTLPRSRHSLQLDQLALCQRLHLLGVCLLAISNGLQLHPRAVLDAVHCPLLQADRCSHARLA